MDVFFFIRGDTFIPTWTHSTYLVSSDLSSFKIRFADKHFPYYDIGVSLGSGFSNTQMASQQYDGAHCEQSAAGVNLWILQTFKHLFAASVHV